MYLGEGMAVGTEGRLCVEGPLTGRQLRYKAQTCQQGGQEQRERETDELQRKWRECAEGNGREHEDTRKRKGCQHNVPDGGMGVKGGMGMTYILCLIYILCSI